MPSLWRAYLFLSAHKTLPSISVTAEYGVSFTFSLWKWNCKFIYQAVNHIGGCRNSLCGLIPKTHHSHQFSLPGVCCLPWDFPEVKALLTVSKATGKSNLAKSLNEIYQTNTQKITFIISASITTSFPRRGWGQGEQHPQRETISARMESCAPVLGLERKKVEKNYETTFCKGSEWTYCLFVQCLFRFHKVTCFLLICFPHSIGGLDLKVGCFKYLLL